MSSSGCVGRFSPSPKAGYSSCCNGRGSGRLTAKIPTATALARITPRGDPVGRPGLMPWVDLAVR
jgi:hypothetical protein